MADLTIPLRAGPELSVAATKSFIASLSAFSNVLLIFTIRTTGAVFASQAGYAMTAGGIMWSVILLNESMSVWIWAALACLVSGLVLVMPKQEEELPPGGLELQAENRSS